MRGLKQIIHLSVRRNATDVQIASPSTVSVCSVTNLDAMRKQAAGLRAKTINIAGHATSISQRNLTKLNNMGKPINNERERLVGWGL